MAIYSTSQIDEFEIIYKIYVHILVMCMLNTCIDQSTGRNAFLNALFIFTLFELFLYFLLYRNQIFDFFQCFRYTGIGFRKSETHVLVMSWA